MALSEKGVDPSPPYEKSEGSSSKPLETAPLLEKTTSIANFQTTFASLSMHMTDRLRLLQFPVGTIEIIRATITANWPRGVQATRDYYGSHEFKVTHECINLHHFLWH